MKTLIFASTVVFGMAMSLRADGTNVLSDDKSRISYAIGLQLGHNFKNQELDLNPDLVGQAIKDVLTGSPELLTKDQVTETIASFKKEFQAKMQKKQAEMMAKQAESSVTNKAAGAAFLAKNLSEPGVQVQKVTLPDGTAHEFQYLVLTNGTGVSPSATDTVKVNYRGTLIDGTEFDSSYKRGQPATFRLNQVIPGWTQALQLMKTGSKWRLFLPPDLAYGDRSSPGNPIPAGSTLIFDVELLDVAPAAPRPVMAPAAPLTSDIIKVPSADDMKKGAKIEVIKPQDVPKATNQ